VYNGINLSDYDYSDQKSDRLLFCSTLLREKGIAQAIDIANRNPLDIIGEDMRILDQSLPIHLIQGNNTWKYYGKVGHYVKRMLMRDAKCLLFPVQRDEPGALIPLEAFASGTPVIATNRGCLPEYIKNGVNGFLFNTVEEARNILKNDINKIKPIDCYNTAKRFTSEIMADNYLNFYDKMLSGERW
jgi:glycosyltransferase involved in cell wall biosynthesis